jgi:hypothetical protein
LSAAVILTPSEKVPHRMIRLEPAADFEQQHILL